MSSFSENQDAFAKEVVAKQLAVTQPAMQSRFNRLYFTRRFCEWLFSAILIFGGQQFLLENGLYSPVWPAAGVGLSAIFLRGNLLLLGIFTGSLASYLLKQYPLTVSISNSLLFTINLFLIRFICIRFFGAIAPMHTSKIALQFILVVIACCVLHIGWVYLFYPDLPWLMGVLGEVNGILCLTPLCLCLEPFTVKRLFVKGSYPAWIAGSTVVLGHALFFFIPAHVAIVWAVILIFALWLYAYRFRAASTGMTLLGISIVYLTGGLAPYQLFQRSYPLYVVIAIISLFTLGTIIAILQACRCTQIDFMSNKP